MSQRDDQAKVWATAARAAADAAAARIFYSKSKCLPVSWFVSSTKA
jgi:hypothetical protein